MSPIFGRTRADQQVYTTVLRSNDRFSACVDGVTSRHCFSAGAHHDPNNISFGPLIGVDEHTVDPGAGFGRHAHRGVTIVSWVLQGALRHEDSAGNVEVIEPGTVAVQLAGDGLEHTESNGSSTDPLRFVQMTLLGEPGASAFRAGAPPQVAGGALFDVHRAGPLIIEARRAHLFVADGQFGVRRDAIYPGDSMRITSSALELDGDGELLVLLLEG